MGAREGGAVEGLAVSYQLSKFVVKGAEAALSGRLPPYRTYVALLKANW